MPSINKSNKFPLNVNTSLTLDDQRNCTDVFCLVIGVVLTLIMLLIAIFGYEQCKIIINAEKFIKTNFPADSEGRLCGVELPNYPYLYFAQVPEIVKIKYQLRQEEYVSLSVQNKMTKNLIVLPRKMSDVVSVILRDSK